MDTLQNQKKSAPRMIRKCASALVRGEGKQNMPSRHSVFGVVRASASWASTGMMMMMMMDGRKMVSLVVFAIVLTCVCTATRSKLQRMKSLDSGGWIDAKTESVDMVTERMRSDSAPPLFQVKYAADAIAGQPNDNAYRFAKADRADDCTSGVFFVGENKHREYVFKPASLESHDTAESRGVDWGYGACKELAAYYLDHKSFARVPPTIMFKAKFACGEWVDGQEDTGSLQMFAANLGPAGDQSSSNFLVRDVHAIGLLDCRLAQLDRHDGNMLYKSDGTLVPIDHGLTLPSYRNLRSLSTDFVEWMGYRQSHKPFDDVAREYVAALRPWRDIAYLNDLRVPHESIMTYILCSHFVKMFVEARKTLYEIGSAMMRDGDSLDPSLLEEFVTRALDTTNFHSFEFTTPNSWTDDAVHEFVDSFIADVRKHLLLPPTLEMQRDNSIELDMIDLEIVDDVELKARAPFPSTPQELPSSLPSTH